MPGSRNDMGKILVMNKNSKKIGYLAGGMTGLTIEEASEWRQKIKDTFFDFSDQIAFFNPVDHCWEDKVALGLMTEKEAMEIDLYKLQRSDFMIVNFNNPCSIGTNIEIGFAHALGIPIIGLDLRDLKQRLHSWQIELTHKIFTNMEDMLCYIVDHFLYDD